MQQKILKALASLQLTVILFALAMVLVFWGTLAQTDLPNWVVVEKYFRSGVVLMDMKYLSVFMQKFFELPKDVEFNFKLPFPGGWLIGIVMILNLIAAHLMRFRLTWKRAAVMVVHTGLVMLMLGELFTGVLAVESRMTMKIGEKSNFLDVHYEPLRTAVELAFIDSSDPKEDSVTVVTSDYLKKVGSKISNDLLPVDVEILEYHKNSEIAREPNPNSDSIYSLNAAGVAFKPIPSEEYSDLTEEHPAAPMVRVRLRDKTTGDDLGTHVFTLWMYRNFNNRAFGDQPRTVEANGKTYRLEFRAKRVMEPFTLELLKFEHDVYQGTGVARNFRSTVRLLDPERGVDRVETITMNEPLRYRGLSFFQSGVLPGDSGTILQVVNNPSWLIPYFACGVISLALLAHFLMGLTLFLMRRANLNPAPIAFREERYGSTGTGLGEHLFAWGVVALAASYLIWKCLPGKVAEEEIDYRSIGELPILDGGRVKPLDSLARSSLLTITSKQEWIDNSGKTRTAVEWIVSLLDAPDPYSGPGSEAKVFRIEHEDLLKLFDLPRRPGSYRYSLDELQPNWRKFRTELAQAENRAEKIKRKQIVSTHEDDLRDAKLLDLNKKIGIYSRLLRGEPFVDEEFNDKRPRLVPPLNPGGDEWRTLNRIDESMTFTEAERDQAHGRLNALIERRKAEMGGAFEPPTGEQYEKLLNVILAGEPTAEKRATVHPAAGLLTTVLRAASRHQSEPTREGRVEQAKLCNDALKELRKYYETVPPRKLFSAKLESLLNSSGVFFYSSMLYIFVILIGCLSWLFWSAPLRRGAFYLALFTSVIHGLALTARMVISERPPVTNLYGSAVFIGWGCMTICLFLESVFKNGIATVGGGILGGVATFIAHHLAETGDTLDVLQAVLDTNFWLTVHVLTVTMGYVATLVLGIIALVYLFTGIFLPVMDKTMSKTLGNMMYGTCCFAMLLSFFGTTSGGIWGDQSWGRFWGWDPKENGAVLVVIWNALILHARWCGLVKERGMAVLALVGNMVTFWSWFGTNQLGVGLHAYGFNATLAEMCRWVWLGHVFAIVLGLMPLTWWSSYASLTESSRLVTVTGADVAREKAELAISKPEGAKPNGQHGGKKKGKNRR